MTKLAPTRLARPLVALALSLGCALAPALSIAAPTDVVALDAKDPSPAVPGNWTLGEREQWKALQKELDQHVALMNTACQATIAVTFDHETFRGKLMEAGYTGVNASRFTTHMNSSVSTVRELCLRGGPSKDAVKAKITKISIQHAGASRAHKVEQGKLTTVLDPDTAPREWQTKFQEFLMKSL